MVVIVTENNEEKEKCSIQVDIKLSNARKAQESSIKVEGESTEQVKILLNEAINTRDWLIREVVMKDDQQHT